jgi:hypothetical protein
MKAETGGFEIQLELRNIAFVAAVTIPTIFKCLGSKGINPVVHLIRIGKTKLKGRHRIIDEAVRSVDPIAKHIEKELIFGGKKRRGSQPLQIQFVSCLYD